MSGASRAALHLDLDRCKYRALIGVGGIGAGRFFALDGDHTLGREESRSGHFLEARDYCKLHIIAHYVQTLLGGEFTAIPVGRVGADDLGDRLLQEMRDAGMDLRYVKRCPGEQTLYSLCFVYPDGSGGNLTVDDSACARLDREYVLSVEPEFSRYQDRGIALAAPEVPLAARRQLLELATAYGFYRCAALTSGEMALAGQVGFFGLVDLLSMNTHEAAALAGLPAGQPVEALVAAVVEALSQVNPGLVITVTAGEHGSWAWDGRSLHHAPAIPVQVAGTAGAGDAFLAGMIVGRVAGLDVAASQQLAVLVASLSVTSPHTIHLGLDRVALRAFVQQHRVDLMGEVRALLGS
jgi:sugar/nucleoside kinase (ribokinase family)